MNNNVLTPMPSFWTSVVAPRYFFNITTAHTNGHLLHEHL